MRSGKLGSRSGSHQISFDRHSSYDDNHLEWTKQKNKLKLQDQNPEIVTVSDYDISTRASKIARLLPYVRLKPSKRNFKIVD
jgi:hypothetical protein